MTDTPQSYKNLLASEDEVAKRIDELAAQIIKQYKDKRPLFVCLLRGGAPFTARLMFAIAKIDPDFHPELDYMTIKTYGNERTSRPPELIADLLPSTEVAGRHVILLDDVLDTGVTADFTHQYMIEHQQAASVDMIVLVQKDVPRQTYPKATLWGFDAPAEWLTGMGMDDARVGKEGNRWAGYIAIAHQ